jgi:hypothetical protein
MNRDNREYFLNFFKPTPGLTRAIAGANRDLILEDSEEGLTALDREEMDEEPEEGEHLFGNEVDGLIIREPERPTGRGPDDFARAPTVADYQHLISKRLHGFLAFLARSEQARSRARYDIFQIVPEGMERRLGLNDRSRRYEGLLQGLAEEFRGSLMEKHRGRFGARWGEIHMVGPRHVVLVESAEQRREAAAPYERATLSTRATRAAGGRRGR